MTINKRPFPYKQEEKNISVEIVVSRDSDFQSIFVESTASVTNKNDKWVNVGFSDTLGNSQNTSWISVRTAKALDDLITALTFMRDEHVNKK